MSNVSYPSWGRLPAGRPARVHQPAHRSAILPDIRQGPLLGYGRGRSYGDSPRNDQATLIDTRSLNRFVSFDATTGVLECEPGVTLADILALVVPQGWFLPVTPGTQFVTVAGAIANDVHGKNHHVAGTFGCHVLDFDLATSDGALTTCCPSAHAALFGATIGGLGLTGMIARVRLALRRIAGPFMDVETIRFDRLSGFFDLSAAAATTHEYTVAWVDCSARGRALGRGHFIQANHLPALGQERRGPPGPGPRFPVTPPFSLMNRATLAPLNSLYFHRQRCRRRRARSHYQPYFYPLDGIAYWNRAYGPRGFYQYQCVVPLDDAQTVIAALLERIAASGQGSFLSVLKLFGERPSPGLMSFPRPGATLALDFPNQESRTTALLTALDEIVMAAGGAVYPAKDARMSPAAFRAYFPQWQQFNSFVDPAFSSSFWRRVMGESA